MSNSVTVKVQYTKDQRNRVFVETGKSIDSEERKLDIDTMTSEQRSDLLVISWHTTSRFRSASTIEHSRVSKEYSTNKPCVGTGDTISFDHVPTDEDLLKLMSELAEEKRQVQAEVVELMPAWREADKARKIEEEAQRKRKAARDEEWQQRRDEEREQKRVEGVVINWSNGTALFDLHNGLCVASGLSYDHRWQSWVKEITGIDRSKNNGYMYEGEFVSEGTVELDENERRVFLVASETGSNKYRTTFYQVVVLENGELECEDLHDDDDKPGWALRMREGISELLGNVSEERTINIPEILLKAVFEQLNRSSLEDVQELAISVADLLNS